MWPFRVKKVNDGAWVGKQFVFNTQNPFVHKHIISIVDEKDEFVQYVYGEINFRKPMKRYSDKKKTILSLYTEVVGS